MAGMQKVVDLYVVYRFIRALTTPFEKTPAYKHGIIDKDGNVLRRMRDLKSPQEKNAWTWFDILINNLKRILAKLPGGRQKWFAYAASLYLLRESPERLRALSECSCEELETNLNESAEWAKYCHEARCLVEDAPANAAGTGAVAGLGVGPQGEPGVALRRRRRRPPRS